MPLGLVGCGRLARAGYVPALALVPDVRLVAVADPDVARREQVASLAAGASTPARYADTAGLVQHPGLQAVVLATPAATHLPDAELAVVHGLAVLVEKPPALDRQGAARLARLEPRPWIGFNRRFDMGVRAIRAGVPAEGEIKVLASLRYRRASWGAHVVRDDALNDLGPHLVDCVRWVSSSDIIEVLSAEVRPEAFRIHARTTRGLATLEGATNRIHREVLEVCSSSGRQLGRHRLGGLAGAAAARLRATTRPSPLVLSLASQLDALASAVRNGANTDLGSATDGHAAMAVLEAARASAGRGGAVPVLAGDG